MRRVLSRSLRLLSTILIIVTCAGCSNSQKNYTNLEWLCDLAVMAGIQEESKENYFPFENDENSDYIAGLVSWEVIRADDEIDPSANLNRDFMAYTLVNLIAKDDVEKIYVKDIEDSAHPYAVYTVVTYGVVDLDDQSRYLPKNAVSEKEAKEALQRVLTIINDQTFSEQLDIEFDKETTFLENLPPSDGEYYPIMTDREVGEYICDQQEGKLYKIIAKDQNGYKLEEIDPLEAIEELKFSGTYEDLDLSDAEIEIYGESVKQDSIYDQDGIERVAKTNDVFEIKGYRVSYNISLNKIHFRISKKNDNGINLYFDSDIYGISPSYKWDYENGVIKDAYFKVDFKTGEEIGLSKGRYKFMYGDYDSLKGEDLFDNLRNFLKPKDDLIETSFTLMKIKLPIPNLPLVSIESEVKLNIYMSGKAEIVLDTSHSLGLAIKNNSIRLINDHDVDVDLNLNATASSTLSLIFSLNLFKDLVDIRFNGGIKAMAQTTLHFYDSQGRKKSQSVNGEYDALSELADRDDVFVCADLSFSWILNIEFNSDDTLAYTLGLNKKIDILNEDDQVFGNLRHIEKGMFTEKCTYEDRNVSPLNPEIEISSDRISLDTYSMVVRDKMSIPIRSLPDGYKMADIMFASEDTSIASVDTNGNVTPLKNGVCRIRVYTNDQKYDAYINILVSKDEALYLFI